MPCAKKSSSTSTDGFNQVETAAAERKGGRKKRREIRKTTEKKLKYAKEFRGSFFFSVCQDETICRTHHSNVFTALYSKIDHFI